MSNKKELDPWDEKPSERRAEPVQPEAKTPEPEKTPDPAAPAVPQKAAEPKKRGHKKLIAVLIVAAVGVAAIFGCIFLAPVLGQLDRITQYNVDVVPERDGSLDITYHITWKVLNDSREGPLTWVKIGVANPDFTITGTGGAIAGQHVDFSVEDGSYAEFDLDKAYYKGSTADFWFTVNQREMLSGVSALDASIGQCSYTFIPGWFTDIKVDHYQFTWADSTNVLSSNADQTQDGKLIWSGSLNFDKSRVMDVSYNPAAFESGAWMYAYAYQSDYAPNSGDKVAAVISVVGVITIIVIVLILMPRRTYIGGRGFFWYGGGHGGSGGIGGGGGCACAGCACACACAGGGRAGCSEKDFYRKPEAVDDGEGK